MGTNNTNTQVCKLTLLYNIGEYSSTVDRGFKPRWGQTTDYNIGICFISAKHTALRRTRTYWSACNRDNVSRCGNMSIRGLLFSRLAL